MRNKITTLNNPVNNDLDSVLNTNINRVKPLLDKATRRIGKIRAGDRKFFKQPGREWYQFR